VDDRDVYDRTLAYVYRLPDGLFVNAELVRQGYARVLTIPPNVAHTDELVALAGEARDAGRGLWSACSAA
jgi:micrococcal nuclease